MRNFAVKKYNGDETHRAVRNETHIYFTQETKFLKDSEQGLEILPQTFDLFKLSDVDRLKEDNRYLIGNHFFENFYYEIFDFLAEKLSAFVS